jgi:hypothetical protein
MVNEELQLENDRLRAAIIKHRSQKADDRCIEDDDELYAVLGDGIKCDRRVGDKFEMLQNCIRFIRGRCLGGGWPTYVELEAEIKRLTENESTLLRAVESACHAWNMTPADERTEPLQEAVNKLSNAHQTAMRNVTILDRHAPARDAGTSAAPTLS